MKLVSVEEAAKQLGIKVRQARNLIHSGILPATRVGRVHVIRAEDVEKAVVRPSRGRPRKNSGKNQ